MGWIVVIVIAGLLLADLVVRLMFVSVAVRVFEAMPPLSAEPSVPDADAEVVHFPTTDGLTLQGSLHRHIGTPGQGVIIFCPELGRSHWSAMTYCQGLWDAGFDILSFDFRNQDGSDVMPGYEPLHWVTEYEVDDVLAAVRYARHRPELHAPPLGIFGISRGGGAALIAGARCKEIECVAVDGAIATDAMMVHHARRWMRLYSPGWLVRLIPVWHVRVTVGLIRWVSQYRRGCRYPSFDRWLPRLRNKPVFLVCGERDNYVNPLIVDRMAERIGPGRLDVWFVPEAKHNQARQVETQEYDRRLSEFFSSGLSSTLQTEKVTQTQV